MNHLLNLDRYPIANLGEADGKALVRRSVECLMRTGILTLPGFVLEETIRKINEDLKPVLARSAFRHTRHHNIYFDDSFDQIPPNHPALRQGMTMNHTISGDQIPDNPICKIYQWPSLVKFLSTILKKKALYIMSDPIAALNVLEYRPGEPALNWHFDRSEFTITILLSSATFGGKFEYRSSLRTKRNPNYDGIAALLTNRDSQVQTLSLEPGTLCVFRGVETAHRVTPVNGQVSRIVAVFSYYERPDVRFGSTELLGFYGRTE